MQATRYIKTSVTTRIYHSTLRHIPEIPKLKANIHAASQAIYRVVTEQGSSLPGSKDRTICPYPDPNLSSPPFPTTLDMIWCDMILYMIWCDIWYNMIWLMWCDMIYMIYGIRYMMWCGVMLCDMIYCMIWYDVIYDIIWYDRCDVISYDMIYMIYYIQVYDIWYMIYDIWCDVVWCYVIWYDIVRYDMIYDMRWYDMIWYDMIYDMIYLLTVIELTPGCSNTVHIYAQTIHRTTQLTTSFGRLSLRYSLIVPFQALRPKK
jgi:hypothetical protein